MNELTGYIIGVGKADNALPFLIKFNSPILPAFRSIFVWYVGVLVILLVCLGTRQAVWLILETLMINVGYSASSRAAPHSFPSSSRSSTSTALSFTPNVLNLEETWKKK